MIRYLSLYYHLVKFSIINEMEYRFDFLANVARYVVWVIVAYIGFLVIFQQTTTIVGWNKNEAFVLFGVYMLIDEIWFALFSRNLNMISEYIRLGTLDYILLRPVSTQFLVSLKELLLVSVPNVFIAFGIIGYYLHQADVQRTFLQVLIGGLLIVNSILMLYSIMIIAVTLAFWIIELKAFWELYDIFTEGARYPIGFYKEPLRFILTFIIPLAIMFTFPAQFLVKNLSWEFIILSFVVGGMLFFAAHKFFYFGIKHYNSASS